MSHIEWNIGGIPVTIVGLNSNSTASVVGVFILHGRGGNRHDHIDLAIEMHHQSKASSLKLVVFLIDQRNHGDRLVDAKMNQGWPDNINHARDMYAIQLGTAADVTYLKKLIPVWLNQDVASWGVCGFSLGGHATLLLLANGIKNSN